MPAASGSCGRGAGMGLGVGVAGVTGPVSDAEAVGLALTETVASIGLAQPARARMTSGPARRPPRPGRWNPPMFRKRFASPIVSSRDPSGDGFPVRQVSVNSAVPESLDTDAPFGAA